MLINETAFAIERQTDGGQTERRDDRLDEWTGRGLRTDLQTV